MKISFWIPAIVLCAVSIAFSNSVQVGTVLFTTTDLVRRCWTESEKSILRARLVMQDVLPDPDCIDFSNPKAAMVLLDYFLACFEIISRSSYGKIQNLMFIALSDALGGYLRAYVLPSAKRAYYAGQMKYSEVEQLFTLYDNIRTFLKTNGGGWAEPQKLCRRKFHVLPLVITGGDFEACKQLHIIEKKGKLHCINPPRSYKSTLVEPRNIELTKDLKASYREEPSENFKNSKYFSNSTLERKRSSGSSKEGDGEEGFSDESKKLNCSSENSTTENQKLFKNSVKILTNETEETLEDSNTSAEKKCCCGCTCPHCAQSRISRRVIVPLPMLDDCQAPQSIIVPFKDRPLRNLHSASSAFILEYYYIAVIKCFIAKGNTRTDIKNFNAEFYSWLVSEVLPHLNDERWYSGFGGVLRIVETIKKFGANSGLSEPCFHDTGYAFEKGVEFEVGDTWNKEGKDQPRNIVEETSPNTKRHVITAILVVSLLWLFLFCACAFYSQATRGRDLLYEGSSEPASSRARARARTQPTCKVPVEKNKSMNFHFLIKFFKKKEQKEVQLCKDNEKQVYWSIRKLKNENLFEKIALGQKQQVKAHLKKKLDFKLDDKPKEVIHGKNDFSTFQHSKKEETFKPILPFWPSRSCLAKAQHKSQPGFLGVIKPSRGQEPRDKVTLLWKKPSVKFKRKEGTDEKLPKERYKLTPSGTTTTDFVEKSLCSYSASTEDSKNSTSKQNICSCSNESCQHTPTSWTNCSSLTKVKQKSSSTTMEFFEDVVAKRKPYMKLKSTEESGCDDEASTSNESDY